MGRYDKVADLDRMEKLRIIDLLFVTFIMF